MSPLETDWHREAILTGGDGAKVALRVRYRERGTRRWTRFLVVPQKGQSIADLVPYVSELAEQHARRQHLPEDAS